MGSSSLVDAAAGAGWHHAMADTLAGQSGDAVVVEASDRHRSGNPASTSATAKRSAMAASPMYVGRMSRSVRSVCPAIKPATIDRAPS